MALTKVPRVLTSNSLIVTTFNYYTKGALFMRVRLQLALLHFSSADDDEEN
jgi:hypothetical protein